MLDLGQPIVSHHLKILVEAGLLHREKRGTRAYYSLVPGAWTTSLESSQPNDSGVFLSVADGTLKVFEYMFEYAACPGREWRPAC
ncbi:ArsR family transcriptional regulator [Paenarthrobacter nitroguajacolicus]|uniref:ArsR family transcriptional regulator n=1 Tax=Paenarthrobacter nitroguajacolicus TaxID=211146 RepID=UPI003AECA864